MQCCFQILFSGTGVEILGDSLNVYQLIGKRGQKHRAGLSGWSKSLFMDAALSKKTTSIHFSLQWPTSRPSLFSLHIWHLYSWTPSPYKSQPRNENCTSAEDRTGTSPPRVQSLVTGCGHIPHQWHTYLEGHVLLGVIKVNLISTSGAKKENCLN